MAHEEELIVDDDGFLLQDDNPRFDNFTQIPNSVITRKLKPSAYLLYSFYKLICGDTKERRCYCKTVTVSLAIGLSTNCIRSARRELIEAGLIEKKSAKTPAGHRCVLVRIVNIWKENCGWTLADATKPTGDSSTLAVPNNLGNKPDANFAPATNLTQNYCQPDAKLLPTLTQNLRHSNTNVSNTKKEIQKHTKKAAAGCASAECVQGSSTDGFDVWRKGMDQKGIPEKPKSLMFAEKLLDNLARRRKISPKDIKLQRWGEDIRKFMVNNEVMPDEINDVLDWYCENMDDQYVPTCLTAKTFCDKFYRLKDTMIRRNRIAQQSLTPPISKAQAAEDRMMAGLRRLAKKG